MKVMRKDRVLEREHRDYVRAERDVLTAVVHPYVVTLRYSFQVCARVHGWEGAHGGQCWGTRLRDESARGRPPPPPLPPLSQLPSPTTFLAPHLHPHPPPPQTPRKLYLVLDFINGGHLFFQLYRQGTFDEPLARLYAAELVLAIAHLHSLGFGRAVGGWAGVQSSRVLTHLSQVHPPGPPLLQGLEARECAAGWGWSYPRHRLWAGKGQHQRPGCVRSSSSRCWLLAVGFTHRARRVQRPLLPARRARAHQQLHWDDGVHGKCTLAAFCQPRSLRALAARGGAGGVAGMDVRSTPNPPTHPPTLDPPTHPRHPRSSLGGGTARRWTGGAWGCSCSRCFAACRPSGAGSAGGEGGGLLGLLEHAAYELAWTASHPRPLSLARSLAVQGQEPQPAAKAHPGRQVQAAV